MKGKFLKVFIRWYRLQNRFLYQLHTQKLLFGMEQLTPYLENALHDILRAMIYVGCF